MMLMLLTKNSSGTKAATHMLLGAHALAHTNLIGNTPRANILYFTLAELLRAVEQVRVQFLKEKGGKHHLLMSKLYSTYCRWPELLLLHVHHLSF